VFTGNTTVFSKWAYIQPPHPPLTVVASIGTPQNFISDRIRIHVTNIQTGFGDGIFHNMFYGTIIIGGETKSFSNVRDGETVFKASSFAVQLIGLQDSVGDYVKFRIT